MDAGIGSTVEMTPFPIARTPQNLIGIISVEVDYYEKIK